MNKLCFLILIITCVLSNVNSQRISQNVLASCGTVFENLGYRLSFTVGESVIATFQSPNYTLGQGFHQSSLLVTSTGDLSILNKFGVYPNPVSDYINLELVKTNIREEYKLKILSLKGDLLIEDSIDLAFRKKSYDVSSFTSGMYFLLLLDKHGHQAFFKIIKI